MDFYANDFHECKREIPMEPCCGLSEFGTALVSLLAVPFYLKYLGIDAYGLIGFFTALQALFSLLDLGLASTINREVALSVNSEGRTEIRNLLHTLVVVYGVLAISIGVLVASSAPIVSQEIEFFQGVRPNDGNSRPRDGSDYCTALPGRTLPRRPYGCPADGRRKYD